MTLSEKTPPSLDERARLRQDAILVVLVSAAPVLIETALGFVRAGTDLGWFFQPLWRWWWSEWRYLGGWNPWQFAGFPAHADPQLAVLHPLTWLYGVLPPLVAAGVEGALVPAIASLGMLLYLRRIDCSRAASLMGALSFGLGGAMAAHVPHPSIVRCGMMLPWGLLAIEALDGRALLAAIALVVGAMLLAGQPQVSALAVALLTLYALCLGKPFARGRWWVFGAGALLGAVLAAGAILPALQLIGLSTRSIRAPLFPNPTLALTDLPQLVLPFVGGGGIGPLAGPPRSPLACGLIECGAYPGLPVWIGLIAGAGFLLRDPRGRFWAVVALFSVAAATGALPTPTGFRGPARILLWWNVAAAAAAAIGLTGVLRDRRARSIAGAVATVAAVIAIAFALAPAARTATAGAALSLAVTMAALFAVVRGGAAERWLPAALAIDLILFNLTLLSGGARPDELRDVQAQIAAVRGMLDQPACHAEASERVLIADGSAVLPGINWASVDRVPSAQGYDPLVLRSLAALLGQLGDGLEAVGHVSDASLAAPGNAALDVLRVGIVLRDPNLRHPLGDAIAAAAERAPADGAAARWERIEGCTAGRLEAYRNRRARPVAWLADDVAIASTGRAIARVRGTGAPLDLTQQVVLEDASPAAGAAPVQGHAAVSSEPGTAKVVAASADELGLTVRAASAAWLVTSELAFPGWHAEVDGRDAEIVVANGAFRAVRVAAGEHEVRFVYRPRLAIGSMAVSALGVVAVLALAASARRRREAA